MADVTKQIGLTTAWKNLTAATPFLAGRSYTASMNPIGRRIVVRQAVTDDDNPPSAAIVGHAWVTHPAQSSDEQRSRRMTATAGQRLWLKVETPATATIVITEV